MYAVRALIQNYMGTSSACHIYNNVFFNCLPIVSCEKSWKETLPIPWVTLWTKAERSVAFSVDGHMSCYLVQILEK